MAPLLHWPTQSSKSLAHVGPPQPSRQTHENEPGKLTHSRALMQGPSTELTVVPTAVAPPIIATPAAVNVDVEANDDEANDVDITDTGDDDDEDDDDVATA